MKPAIGINDEIIRAGGLLIPLAIACLCSPPVIAQQQASIPLGIALESYLYPFPVHFLETEMEGQLVRMAYMDVPPSGTPNGQTMVLLHGKNFGGYYWEKTIKRF